MRKKDTKWRDNSDYTHFWCVRLCMRSLNTHSISSKRCEQTFRYCYTHNWHHFKANTNINGAVDSNSRQSYILILLFLSFVRSFVRLIAFGALIGGLECLLLIMRFILFIPVYRVVLTHMIFAHCNHSWSRRRCFSAVFWS